MSKLKSVLRGALIICAVVLAGYGTGVAQRHMNDAMHADDPIRITFNPGGSVTEFIEDFTAARNAGKRYIVDGYCISACTMILGLIPSDHVCATPYAKLAFHSASLVNPMTGEHMGRAAEGTRLAWHVYPPKVRELLKQHGWDGEGKTAEHPNLIYIEGDELLTLIAPCKDTL